MTGGLSSTLAGILRVVSRAICLIVLLSFAIFVVDQTGNASTAQQSKVAEAGAPAEAVAPAPVKKPENSVHRTIDEAASTLTSPFSGVTAGSSSEWVTRGVGTLLALLVYGFGLGFLARIIRVRV